MSRETRMDLQKVGQLVEMAQKWTYISLTAMFVWKVVRATWKRCTPIASLVRNSETATAGEQRTKLGDPFFIA
ncbi:MAG: hypothetical protein AB2556_19510 [Candidatus Thiodiazotropha sp.]